MKRQITFVLGEDKYKEIEKMCVKTQRTKASLVRYLVFKKLEEIKNGETYTSK